MSSIIDRDAAETELTIRADHHDQLVGYIAEGIKAGIAAYKKHELALGSTLSTSEVNWALADVIIDIVGAYAVDHAAVERFIDDLRTLLAKQYEDPQFKPWL